MPTEHTDHTEKAVIMNSGRAKSVRSKVAAGLLSGLCLILVAGCSIPMPQAQSDPTKYYVLSVIAPSAAPAETAKAPAVRLRPVELPSYLRGESLVVRRGSNQIEFREFARWGEPLEQGIARVLREELLARRAAASVAAGVRPSAAGDVQDNITVRVLACEGNADGTINFAAAWEIEPTAAHGATVHGEYHAEGLKWAPHDDATLAAALSHAVAGLAGEIAGGLAKAE